MPAPHSPIIATCASPAKVNLCLRIVGRRADGYHLLDSIFAAIDFADRITMSVRDVRQRGATSVVVHCAYPGVPNDGTNLVARAVVHLLDACGIAAHVTITIDKQIPVGAGLGGGSSNAAAALRCLTAALRLEISEARVHEIALGLGADVPFFLTGGCARVRGIGDDVQPIRQWPDMRLVVATPSIAVSTARAFRAYAGGYTVEPSEPARMASGSRPDASSMVNDLETAVLSAHPEIAEVKRALVTAGAEAAVMSGSGSAVVGVLAATTEAGPVIERFRRAHPGVAVRPASLLAPDRPIG